ncbi:MAG: amidohydrolase family protein [Armatimonadetes bacterium]|nr:amidohydrolase family protein [Armatimonadota bacterium]
MEFWDVNTIIGPWQKERQHFSTAGELCEHLDEFGIRKALVSHTLAAKHSDMDGNRILGREIAGREGLIPCWVLDTASVWRYGGVERLRAEMAGAGAKAVRVFPASQRYNFEKWNVAELFDFLEVFAIPVLVDHNELKQDLGPLDAMCREYPRLPIVMCGVPGGLIAQEIALLRRNRNLYLDSSGIWGYCGLEEIVARCGPEQILFGSRMPFFDAGCAISRVTLSDISDADQALVGSGNLARLLAGVEL